MLIIGFIFIASDITIDSGKSYPQQYDNSDQVIGEFQYYNIASNYGARCTYKLLEDKEGTVDAKYQGAKVIDKVFYTNIRIDIFNDFLGFLLIILACIKLKVSSKKFIFASLCALGGFVIHGIITALPFVINGLLLCNAVFVIGMIYLLCIVSTTFMFTSGLLEMCPDVSCRDERKWCKMCWFISCVLQILTTFIFWLGSDFKSLYNLGLFFEFILVIDIIIFLKLLYRTRAHIESFYKNAINQK